MSRHCECCDYCTPETERGDRDRAAFWSAVFVGCLVYMILIAGRADAGHPA